MLKRYIDNKMYVGILFRECPLSQESILGIRDRYYAETSAGLYIFINEAALKRRGIKLSISANDKESPELLKPDAILCPA